MKTQSEPVLTDSSLSEIVSKCKSLNINEDKDDSEGQNEKVIEDSRLAKGKENESDGYKEKEKDKDEGEGKKKSAKVKTEEMMELLTLIKTRLMLGDPEGEIISRSPMRSHDYHHYGKPYEYPQSASSRIIGGKTRVTEQDLSDLDFPQNMFYNPQNISPSIAINGEFSDVNIEDVCIWASHCQKNPGLLYEFVKRCEDEYQTDVPSMQEYRNNRRSVCSSSSSQISSPAQSPSEHNVTSPESAHEDYSLYYPKSPNIPSFEGMNINNMVSEDEEIDKILRKPPSPKEEEIFDELKNLSPCNIGPQTGGGNDSSKNIRSSSAGATPPNIGTVMLNLASDPYESTIDLNHFANVCGTSSSPTFPITEKECLNEKLDPKAKENAWARISQLDVDLLGKGDKEGDTQLMILLVSEKRTLEYIYVIVERLLKENANYLSLRNELNQDALYLAACKMQWEPLVASYIAEALIRGKQDVMKKYDNGDTLLHCLVKQGDSHVKVIERLVQMRNPDGTPCFDLNRKNSQGCTPLHIACALHQPTKLNTYKITQILLEYGADCSAQDYVDENTPLHKLIMESCDVKLLRILLESGQNGGQVLTIIENRQGNTALHLACKRNNLELSVQKEVVECLLRNGAKIQLRNNNGCVPSVLVDSARKQEMKNILHGYRRN